MIEFRNTQQDTPLPSRSDSALLEDLCVALRNVAVFERSVRAGESVEELLAVTAEIDRRGIPYDERLTVLADETGWRIRDLLADCRAYPEGGTPLVKEADGVRRAFRCHYCRAAEFPEGASEYFACDDCMQRMLRSFESRIPMDGTMLYRTFSKSWRCSHATDETVLISPCDEREGLWAPGECVDCFSERLRARRQHGSQAG